MRKYLIPIIILIVISIIGFSYTILSSAGYIMYELGDSGYSTSNLGLVIECIINENSCNLEKDQSKIIWNNDTYIDESKMNLSEDYPPFNHTIFFNP